MCRSRSIPTRTSRSRDPVTIGVPTDVERTEIAVRYLGDELGRRYASDTDGTLSVAVRITPERWLTTDYAKFDVPVG